MAKEFICNKTTPVVETTKGKIRGFFWDGTYTFHGIKYAQGKRFQKPQEVEPWDGIKDAISYGHNAPLMCDDPLGNELLVTHRFWPTSEDCLYLNVWTSSIKKESKKPVMVWIHGGGFFSGSAIEHQSYDGKNLSYLGDVVVVSINHRLNILGYFDLSEYSDKYENSGNVGGSDIIASLKWVRDNIENFGGDPDNVTVFGQSGGGMKITTLMQTEEAEGLFHKGIIQSGVSKAQLLENDCNTGPIVDEVVKIIGIENMETVPFTTLVEAYMEASKVVGHDGSILGFRPCPNGFYKGDPRAVGFSEFAKTIPLLIGTVQGEFYDLPEVDKTSSEEEIHKAIEEKYGKNAEKLTELFTKAYPENDLTKVLTLDSMFRKPTIDYIETRTKEEVAPTYAYLLAHEFDLDGGRAPWHCAEIPFVMHNSHMVPPCCAGEVEDRLQEQFFNAWVSFAKTGNPNCDLLPQWKPCENGKEWTMIFKENCELKCNHDKELEKLHSDSVYNPF